MPYANPEHKRENDRKNYVHRRQLRIARERARQLSDPVGYKARMRRYYIEVGREKNYRGLYGIGVDDYDRMLVAQGGKCKICAADKPSPKRKHFAVDHCHSTGRVRGLLCIKCNSQLGWLERYDAAIRKHITTTLPE